MTPQELTEAAKCFECIPLGLQNAIIIYLLNQVQENSLTGGVKCGPGDPSGDPGVSCMLHVNTTDDSLWRWNGTDWFELIA